MVAVDEICGFWGLGLLNVVVVDGRGCWRVCLLGVVVVERCGC